jgi:predicted secreted Zn-dependent protease
VKYLASLAIVGINLLTLKGDEVPPHLHGDIAGAEVAGCTSAVHYTYYDVTGSTIREVREQLLKRGPRDAEGTQRFAYAAWTIEWEWPRDSAGKRRLEDTVVTCTSEIMLPRFIPGAGASLEVKGKVNHAFTLMQNHELKHVEHAVQTTREIREEIVTAARDGKLTKAKQVNQLVLRGVARARVYDRRYDEMTNHGKSEGIWMDRGPD